MIAVGSTEVVGPAPRAVVCTEVSKHYGGTRALDGFSMALPEGCVAGVLGPNGAGKSTLLRVLTGLTKPQSGDVEVLGQRPGWRTNEGVAYLPDRARWYRHHTVKQAFEWAEKLLPGFEPETAQAMADSMHLRLSQGVRGMSRGQEARLMLTICLARRVPLLILDEPFAGIDLVSRERIIEGLIDGLAERQQTVIVSTHEIREVESLLDQVVFIDEGRTVLAGSADDLRRERGSIESVYRSLYR